MVLANWLAVFEARLKLSRFFRRRPRLRKRYNSFGYAAAMVFEDRQLLSAAVTAVSPNQATTQGGTSVQIVGSGFSGVTGVMFGSVAASSWTVTSTSAIAATAPSHSAGQVDIVVDTNTGNSPVTSSDQFTFTSSAPTVTGVGPSSGSTSGGNSVTITGTGFSGVSAVLFGGTYATAFTVTSATSITATAPAHSATGSVDVIVVSSQGSSAVNSGDQYTYSANSSAPTVTGVSPNTGTGSGGTSITITGANFSGVTGVSFGGTAAASFVTNSPTSITATTPSHTPGNVDITVTTSAGTSQASSADQYNFTAPVTVPAVTGLGTTSGTTAGGTSVTIMGTNFTNVTSVMFDTVNAQSFTVNSSTSITAVTAAESAGVVDVKVTNSAGTSALTSADHYTFQSPGPVVTSLGTTTGTTAGGTSVVINGTNFLGTTAVFFSGVSASFTLNSPTSITAITPSHVAGTVDVTVQSPNGTSATSVNDQYQFVTPAAPPTVTALSASTGPAAGGTSITITGTNFVNVSGVFFGGVAASTYTVNSSTSIVVTSPSGSGMVDITVATSAGTSATSGVDQYTFGNASTTPPTIAALGTSAGSTAGGTSVTIFGTGFLGAAAVKFGSVAAASFTILSDGVITAVAPAEGAGTVDVSVQNSAGTSALP